MARVPHRPLRRARGEPPRRYAMRRFGSASGFNPPYFYDRPLIDRLYRAAMPSVVVWGADDHMVPVAHGRAYSERLGRAQPLKLVDGAGHAVHLEKPDEVLAQIAPVLAA